MENTTAALSPTRYFWLHLATLMAGVGALVTLHEVTRRMNDSVDGPTLAMVVALTLLVAASLATVARSAYVLVASGLSDAYRVFRSRHLFVCAALLFLVAGTGTGTVVLHEPFDKLFAHGRITGEDIVDVGLVVAAIVCAVGAGVAVAGAWDTRHDERHWYRSLHLPGHRRI